MRVADLTTVELQRLGSAVLRAYLDASAGRQPLPAMQPWIAAQRVDTLPGVAGTSHTDMGPVTVIRQGSDQVFVAAAVRNPESGDSAHATLLAAELASGDGALRITRLGHSSMRSRGIDSSDRWPLQPEPPEHLTKLLGPLPTTESARARWVTAAAVISDYRETWHLEDSGSALGPLPQDSEQRRERERAVDIVRELVTAIDKEEPGRSPVGREVPGPDLSR